MQSKLAFSIIISLGLTQLLAAPQSAVNIELANIGTGTGTSASANTGPVASRNLGTQAQFDSTAVEANIGRPAMGSNCYRSGLVRLVNNIVGNGCYERARSGAVVRL